MIAEVVPKKSTKTSSKAPKAPVRSGAISDASEDNVCFVISPIGKEGTEIYENFREVLDFIIKPAIESSSLKLKVVRADDINRAGSFIKDILEYILNSYVVIADLTGQNPNVFYELGVRHSISARTIMIAQSLEFVPSDLREYRAITYDTSAKGSKLFKDRLHKFLEDIKEDPIRPDNPVLCNLPVYKEDRAQILEEEISKLKEELNAVLKGASQKLATSNRNLDKTLKRIYALRNAIHMPYAADFQRTEGEKTTDYSLPVEEGNFKCYFVHAKDGKAILDFWYVSVCKKECNLDEELADIRVLMETCSQGQNVNIKFIIVTNDDLSGKKEYITKALVNMKKFIPAKQRPYFKIELWDDAGIKRIENELGIRIEA